MTGLRNSQNTTRRVSQHVDVDALKQANPIESVAAACGIELRRAGRALVGRCPLHADHGRPNFYAWPDTNTWWCFRCNLGGDCIRLIELADEVDFTDAVVRLGAGTIECRPRPARPQPVRPVARSASTEPDVEAQRVLDAAASLYHRSLLTDDKALAYVEQRGVDRPTIQQCKVGFAAGDEFLAYLRWRSLPVGAALRVGLLDAAGREFLAGRIVVPDLHSGTSGWMIGRLLETPASQDPLEELPKYLNLPSPKPLFGVDATRGSPSVVVCEGAFDYLVLRKWGYPAVALTGTYASASMLEQLRLFQCLYVVLDQDDAGLEGTTRLMQLIGPSVVPVPLPDGIKDVAELGTHADGHTLFAQALLDASGSPSVRGLQAVWRP